VVLRVALAFRPHLTTRAAPVCLGVTCTWTVTVASTRAMALAVVKVYSGFHKRSVALASSGNRLMSACAAFVGDPHRAQAAWCRCCGSSRVPQPALPPPPPPSSCKQSQSAFTVCMWAEVVCTVLYASTIGCLWRISIACVCVRFHVSCK
jgi:hypothetical protein